jgi:hypothetical protein
MSKKITINNKVWTGTVTIFDRLYLPQVELVEAALLDEPQVMEGKVKLTNLDKPKLPALLACVEKWDIPNFPENVSIETFPFTPRRAAHELITQIFSEIALVYNGELEVPNA